MADLNVSMVRRPKRWIASCMPWRCADWSISAWTRGKMSYALCLPPKGGFRTKFRPLGCGESELGNKNTQPVHKLYKTVDDLKKARRLPVEIGGP